MRNIRRIPFILNYFKDDVVKHSYLENIVGITQKYQREPIIKQWNMVMDKIEEFWLKSSDMRLSQVLIAVGLLDNIPGSWFYTEDEKFLVDYGIAEQRDLFFWGKNYTKEGKRLEKTISIPLSKLSDEHLKNIFEKQYGGEVSRTPYPVYNEIVYREKNGISVPEEGEYYQK